MTLILHGKPVAAWIQEQVRADVLQTKAIGITPKMVTMLVEGDPASAWYARSKKRIASKLGIEFDLLHFSRHVKESELIKTIDELNTQSDAHGIMVELPLPHHISTERVIETICPLKDVDGLTRFNRHANIWGEPGIYPATPVACVRLLKHYGFELAGKHVVLIGCGKTVGMPLLHLLIREEATVTVCHAATEDLSSHIAEVDIGFVAVGCAGLITPEMVHPNLVLVDAGINETAECNIIGDVDPDVMGHVAALSPTPGGVGAVTTMQLFENLMKAIELQSGTIRHRELVLSP